MNAAAQAALMAWYVRHGRHELPWRKTRDTYAVLVSEVMLQQTQVERVMPYYARWMARWPALVDLAAAEPAAVITAWAGLGYNRRALHLWRAARAVREEGGGEFPLAVEALRRLPGVGAYTASAIACFAGEKACVVLDTNISRVITRFALGRATHRDAAPIELQDAAASMLPASGARHHNLALMDLGATVCTARAPGCDGCPVAGACAWLAAGRPRARAPERTAPAFETTARFARGRIVDALRTGRALPFDGIAAHLPALHRANLDRHLGALERDGLVERSGDEWGLPGRQGRMSIASPKL